ncbi:hypothetical protein SPRG_07222 [Saprolegnia parasitica CBS 223.65]|uniref:FYVE-type domain-containing protein n=1 Tax=Saprolegnia parasitica (strain CBS 223.65) TaxID=695850 RepID=A0A067CN21_SAPPC|nr:hypothetical protein SPRG_07222 [Saprolegnia parasitica CBS 223.65]KDO27946.1 hypothetical protein SPRG_07222 [Saprolegnia parasitica CBS 223.65]|eukprot:XP_012201398.1 hypothetical protein SPRG_07222 [Saprolegnia parasitica CBS 223.65]
MRETRQSFMHAIQSMSKDPLDTHVHAKCARFATSAAKSLATDATKFQFKASSHGIEIYESVSRPYRVKAVALVPGDLEDIMFVLGKQGAKAHEFRKTMFHLFQESFSEGVSLHAPGRGLDQQHVNLNWLALADASLRYDMTYMTATSRFLRRSTGLANAGSCPADVGVQIWQSVEIPELTTFTERDTGCMRLRLETSGFVVERTSTPQTSQVAFHLSFGGASVSSAWMQLLAERLASIASVFTRPGSLQLVPRSIWTFNAYCYSCFKSFGTFRRRHHCRLCGNSICSKCSVSVEITFPGSPTASHYDSTSVPCCHKCADTNSQMDQHLMEIARPSRVSSVTKPSSPPPMPSTMTTTTTAVSPIHLSLRDISNLFAPTTVDAVVSPTERVDDDVESPAESSFFRISKGSCMRVRTESAQSTAPSSQRSSRSTLTESDIEASLELLNDDFDKIHMERLEAAKRRLNLDAAKEKRPLVYLY